MLATDSNVNENTAVARIGNVIIAAQTQAGSDYVKKITHPPTTLPSGYSGRPDASQPNFVPLETKADYNVPLTYTVPTSATTTAPLVASKVLIINSGGSYNNSYVFYRSNYGWVQAINQPGTTGNPLINGNTVAVPSSGYNFDNFRNDVDSFRTGYKSTTLYLNATDFNNQGTRATAKFKPNIYRGDNSTLARQLGLTPAQHRNWIALHKQHFERCARKSVQRFDREAKLQELRDSFKAGMFGLSEFKRLSAEVPEDDEFDVLDENPVDDVGYSFDAQVLDFANNSTQAIVNAIPNWSGNVGFVNVFPETLADVLTLSPKGTTSMARDGDFVVQQPVDTIVEWKSNSTIRSGSVQCAPLGCIPSYIRVATGSTSTIFPLWGAQMNTAVTNAGAACDTPWQNFDWSYQMLDGLSVNTTVTNNPYITIKGFTGWECSATPHGSLLPFQRMLPLPDPEALQMAAGIFHARPDSLPSAANDWGTLGKVVMSALPAVGSWLTGLFGKKAANNVRNVAQTAINAIGQPRPRRSAAPPAKPPARPQTSQLANQMRDIQRRLKNMGPTAKSNEASPMRRFTNANAATFAATRPKTTTRKLPAVLASRKNRQRKT